MLKAGYEPHMTAHAATKPNTTIVRKNFVQPTGVDHRGIGTIGVANGILAGSSTKMERLYQLVVI